MLASHKPAVHPSDQIRLIPFELGLKRQLRADRSARRLKHLQSEWSCAEIPRLVIKCMPNLGLKGIWEAATTERITVRDAQEPQMADEILLGCDRYA